MKPGRISVAVLGVSALFALLLVGLLGPHRVWNGGRAKLKREWLILTGGLVDVGGYRLRTEQYGEGSPTVIFEAGLAQPRKTWGHVPTDVAAFTQVVTYDRAGLGESDPGPVPRTSKQIVIELHNLLRRAGISGPYVFVGHSFGGIIARVYASQYPDDVVGMVLVDASHVDEYTRLAALLPPREREEYLKHEGGGNYEQVDLLASADELRAGTPLKPIPLIVLSAAGKSQSEGEEARAQLHKELQAALVRLVPDASQMIAEKSSHFIQLDRPELVTEAVRKVVEASRQKLARR